MRPRAGSAYPLDTQGQRSLDWWPSNPARDGRAVDGPQQRPSNDSPGDRQAHGKKTWPLIDYRFGKTHADTGLRRTASVHAGRTRTLAALLRRQPAGARVSG